MSHADDVLVIGGGVIGVCTAYYLAQAGRQVTLIEQGRIGGPNGSSYGNAGLIVPDHTTPVPAPGVISKALRWMLDPASPFYIKPRLDIDLIRWLWRFARACRQEPMRRSLSILRELALVSMKLHRELAMIAGSRFDYQPAKGYSITVRRPDRCPAVPISLAEHKVAVTPTSEWLRFAGTLELAGLDRSLNRRRLQAIYNAVREYLPDLEDLEVLEEWAGLRPATPDDLPIVGAPHRVENLMIASGHGMLGMTLGPATGKLVAQLLTGEEPLIDPAPLNPNRFS